MTRIRNPKVAKRRAARLEMYLDPECCERIAKRAHEAGTTFSRELRKLINQGIEMSR